MKAVKSSMPVCGWLVPALWNESSCLAAGPETSQTGRLSSCGQATGLCCCGCFVSFHVDGTMTSLGVKVGSAVSVCVVLLALFYKKNEDAELKTRLDDVLSALLRAEGKVQLPQQPRVAVGFGACQDVFADAVEVMKVLSGVPPSDPVHHNVISSKEELENAVAYFFRHGAAAEWVESWILRRIIQ